MLGHFPIGIIRNKADCLVSVTMGRAHTYVCTPSSVLACTPRSSARLSGPVKGRGTYSAMFDNFHIKHFTASFCCFSFKV